VEWVCKRRDGSVVDRGVNIPVCGEEACGAYQMTFGVTLSTAVDGEKWWGTKLVERFRSIPTSILEQV
jgi:hypothetical protein